MANLLEQVRGAGDQGDIAAAIQQQLGHLTGIGGAVDGLIGQPPSSIGDMVGHLNGTSLQSIPALDALTSGVSGIKALLPARSGDLLSGLTKGFDELESTLKDQIVKPIGDTIDAIKSLVALITGKAPAQTQAQQGPAQAQSQPQALAQAQSQVQPPRYWRSHNRNQPRGRNHSRRPPPRHPKVRAPEAPSRRSTRSSTSCHNR